VNWSENLWRVPNKSLTRLLGFCEKEIRIEDVFDQYNNVRFIRYDVYDDMESATFSAKQEMFKTKFPGWFKEKMMKDPTFASKFIYFCTGSKFFPDLDLNPDWCIRVEFNYSEMKRKASSPEDAEAPSDLVNAYLPVVHT
jgi:hypothetical protein